MPRTKKIVPETWEELKDGLQSHNTETCVCSDCKTRKLELEVIDLKARYADERAHYQAQLANARKELELMMTRMEARINLDWRASLVEVSKRVALMEAGVSGANQAGYSDIVRRLRTLEANRPVEISNRDASVIQRDLKEVGRRLERIADRVDPPNGLPF